MRVLQVGVQTFNHCWMPELVVFPSIQGQSVLNQARAQVGPKF